MNTATTAIATATATPAFVSSPPLVAARLDAWVKAQQTCWVILPTPSGVAAEVYGVLNTRPGGHQSYILHSGDVVGSTVSFPLGAVESVGSACIFLKSSL